MKRQYGRGTAILEGVLPPDLLELTESLVSESFRHIQETAARDGAPGRIDLEWEVSSDGAVGAVCHIERARDGSVDACRITVSAGAVMRLWIASQCAMLVHQTGGLLRLKDPFVEACLADPSGCTPSPDPSILDESYAKILYAQADSLSELKTFDQLATRDVVRTLQALSSPASAFYSTVYGHVAYGVLFLVMHEVAHFLRKHDITRRPSDHRSGGYQFFQETGCEIDADYYAGLWTAKALLRIRAGGPRPNSDLFELVAEFSMGVMVSLVLAEPHRVNVVAAADIARRRRGFVAEAPYLPDGPRFQMFALGVADAGRQALKRPADQERLQAAVITGRDVGLNGLLAWQCGGLEPLDSNERRRQARVQQVVRNMRYWVAASTPSPERVGRAALAHYRLWLERYDLVRGAYDQLMDLEELDKELVLMVDFQIADGRLDPLERATRIAEGIEDLRTTRHYMMNFDEPKSL